MIFVCWKISARFPCRGGIRTSIATTWSCGFRRLAANTSGKKTWEGGAASKCPPDQSPNIALRNPSFRNYADYMLSEKFGAAIARLVERAQKARTAIMCAEQLYFRCHRMLVSDYLVSHGHTVLHIMDDKPPKAHALTKEARMIEGRLVYRGDYLL